MEKNLTPLEKWERMTLADNFIFCKVMEENPEVCKELLEMLLDIKIDRIETPKSEYFIKVTEPSHGIRFDVYVKEFQGRKFDIEIQTANFSELPKRARYYQGVMDVNEVFSGENYTILEESYVIFLCLGDVFGKGLPIYSFENICMEDSRIKLGDKTHKIFFNAKMYDKMPSENLRSFFMFLCGKKSESSFTDRLPELVNRIKMNAKWRQNYMTWEQEMHLEAARLAKKLAPEMAKDLAKDIAKDMAKDIAKDMAKDMATDMARNMAKDMSSRVVEDIVQEKKLEVAKNLLKKSLPAEMVAECIGLSLAEVEKIKNGSGCSCSAECS